MLLSQKTKQKQYCNKFNKDFENGPHQEKKKLKKDDQFNPFFLPWIPWGQEDFWTALKSSS